MACEAKLANAGYAILITFAGRNEAFSATEALLGHGVEAMIFANIAPDESRAVVRNRVPWVQLADGSAPEGVIGISVGRREGAALAARYLQSLGHKAFGVIASSGEDVADAVRTVVGASAMLEISSGDHDLDAARSVIRGWLERDYPPTGIICGSDALALAALRESASQGIRVPQSLSVVGFGDALFARVALPALSTVRVVAAELGARVAEVVLAALEGRAVPSAPIPVKLIARESTAPPGVSGIRSFMNVPRET
jgi:LacI family transcriptional regulator